MRTPILARLLALAMAATALGAFPGAATAAGDQVAAVSLGVAHACAIKTTGSVWCWGSDEWHQLGDGGTAAHSTPTRVRSSPGVNLGSMARLARSSGDHTCVIREDAISLCWGKHFSGQLGDGTDDERLFPVTVTKLSNGNALTRVARLALGDDHSCALRKDATVWCWGFNGSGRLGDGTTDTRLAAVQVAGSSGPLTHVTAIATGTQHTCALVSDGSVRCWGENELGQLGDGTTHDRHRPAKVRKADGTVLRGVTSIAAGYVHTCAGLSDGTVRCWGGNDFGELGDGTTHVRHSPVKVRLGSGFLTGVKGISAGGDNTCAATTSERAYCWGDNEHGQLGDGSTHDRNKAVRVRRASSSFGAVRSVFTSSSHTCAVRTDETAWCWGLNEDGQLGTHSPNAIEKFPHRVQFP